MLTIRLFGVPEIRAGEKPLQLVRRKSRALIYYLAEKGEPVRRDELIELFWMDVPRSSAQQTLRTTLSGLRQSLRDEIITDGEWISLDPTAWIDTRQFVEQLSPVPGELGALREAIALYRGQLLAGFTLPGAQEFEDWMVVQREYYRRMLVRARTAQSRAFEAAGDYASALTSLDLALAFDPLQEDLQRESIRLQYLAGDRPGAIRRYDELRRLLDEEMGVPPMAETRALYDAILLDRVTPAHRRAAPLVHGGRTSPSITSRNQPSTTVLLPFAGRQAELQKLDTMTASGKLILVEGEAGIGKTRLCEEYLHSSQAIALVGRGRELEQSLPYQPVVEALRSLIHRSDWPALQTGIRPAMPDVWWAEVTRLLPELSSSTVRQTVPLLPADEARLWEGVRGFLTGIAGSQTVILFLDDLQWVDASTLGLLGYLVRQAPAGQLRFLGTVRSIPARSPLAALQGALIREDSLERLVLSRLSGEDVQRIAHQISPLDSQKLGKWLALHSEGNPYVLSELVRYARQADLLTAAGELQDDRFQETPVVPPNVYSLIHYRLQKISEPARRILDTAVAAGRDFDFHVVAQAAGLSETAAMDAIEELQEHGFIVSQDVSHFTFDHSLTMEVAYREVGELRHQLLHRRVAEALESVHRDCLDEIVAQLAFHYIEGGAPARAAPFAFRAGQQAARLAAWAEAGSFFELALHGMRGVDRLPILVALGDAHRHAGHFGQAAQAYHDALLQAEEIGNQHEANRIRMVLGRSLLPQSRFTEVVELARVVLQSGIVDDAISAELLWGSALSIEGADLEEARRHLHRARDLWVANPGEDLHTLAQVLFELGSLVAQQGDLAEAVNYYKESYSAALQSNQEAAIEQRILACNNLAYHLHLQSDPTAIEWVQQGLTLAQEKGVLGLQAYLYSTLGEIELAAGHLDEAESYFHRGLSIASRFGVAERVAGLTANLGLIAVQREDFPLAIHRLSSAMGQADALGTVHLAAEIRLWLAPLLPQSEARPLLADIRVTGESSGRRLLLEKLNRLENGLTAGKGPIQLIFG